MSWSIVGSGTPATGGGALVPLNNPGTSLNDYLIAVQREKNSSNAVPGLPGGPTGWIAPSCPDSYMKVFYKVAGASEPNPSAIFSNGYFNTFTIRWVGGPGPAIGSLLDSAGVLAANASPQVNIPFPGITPATDGCFVGAFGFSLGVGSTGSIADASQYPSHISSSININSGCGAIIGAKIQGAAAAIPSGVWVVTNGGSVTVHGIVFALIAGTLAGGGPPTIPDYQERVPVTKTIFI